MPLYEYECIENGHRFELIRKFSDPELKICIKCKSKVRRLLSAPAISFKGTGWYVTDYARKNRNGAGKAPKGESVPKDKSGDSGSSGGGSGKS
ncbi:MAG TPA: FmdB family zinc ribbon protein [Candidatus Saccharimonadales bacterium]|nr:FmdB family zinc ribbon protein [Candidatus Saccharimonadales bacterium]